MALPPLGTQAHTHTCTSRHTHARQPSSRLGPEGARQGAGEFRPPSLSSTAPSSPKCSGLRPDGRGRSLPGSLILSWRCHHSQDPFPWALPLPQGPVLTAANAFPFLVAFNRQPNSLQPTVSVCLSVPHPDQQEIRLSRGVSLLVSRGSSPQGNKAALGEEARYSPALAWGAGGGP